MHVGNVNSDQKLENIIVNCAEEMKTLPLKTQQNAERMKVLGMKEAKVGPRNCEAQGKGRQGFVT